MTNRAHVLDVGLSVLRNLLDQLRLGHILRRMPTARERARTLGSHFLALGARGLALGAIRMLGPVAAVGMVWIGERGRRRCPGEQQGKKDELTHDRCL